MLLSWSTRPHSQERRRRWTLAIFGALLGCAADLCSATIRCLTWCPTTTLAFFATWLYYAEQLAFFDVFLRGGAYFAAGAVLLALLLVSLPASRDALGHDWNRVWLAALTLCLSG